MADDKYIGTTFGEGENSGTYVKTPISEDEKNAVLGDVYGLSDWIRDQVVEAIKIKDKNGKGYGVLFNLDSVPPIEKEAQEAKETLGMVNSVTTQQFSDSFKALKDSAKSFGKGLLGMAVSSGMAGLYYDWAQKSFEKYGDHMPGEGLLFLGVAAACFAGWSIASAYRAGKAGVAMKRHSDILDGIEGAQSGIDNAVANLERSRLNTIRDNSIAEAKRVAHEKYKRNFMNNMETL